MDKIFLNYDQIGLDKQYNVRAAFPDHEESFLDWEEWSSNARITLTNRLNVSYGEGDSQTLDIYLPKSLNLVPLPVNVGFHGGYWQFHDKHTYGFPAQGITGAGGIFVSVNYPLAPDVRMREIVEQCRNAVIWIWNNADAIGADKERIYVSGYSAGGHLASMIAGTKWSTWDHQLPHDLVKGMAILGGIFDLTPVYLSYLNRVLAMNLEEVNATSPINHLPEPHVNAILAVGTKETDEFLRQLVEYERALQKNSNSVVVHYIEDANHFTATHAMAVPDSSLMLSITDQMGLV